MATQVFSPLPYSGGHGPSPDYVTTSDFGYFVNYGLMEAWLSHDHDDPNADCNMARPVTREDVQELREHFLDTMETVIKTLWLEEYSPGEGELDTNDGTCVTIGNSDENPNEEETHLRWYARLDKDALMIELDVTGSDGTAIWLDYRTLNDRKNVIKVLKEARATVGTGEVWDELLKLEDAEPTVVFGEPEGE